MLWRADNSQARAAHQAGARRFLHLGGRFGSSRGQTLLESALVTILFFLLTFGVFDFGRAFYVQMTLQNAVREAGRYASTGNHVPDPKKPGQFLSRIDSIIAIATQAAMGINITGIQITSLEGGKGNAGGPGDVVTVSLSSNLKLITPLIAAFFPNGTYRFTSSATFKNEPFPPNQNY